MLFIILEFDIQIYWGIFLYIPLALLYDHAHRNIYIFSMEGISMIFGKRKGIAVQIADALR